MKKVTKAELVAQIDDLNAEIDRLATVIGLDRDQHQQRLDDKNATIEALHRLVKSQGDQINQFTAERQAIGDAYQRGVDAWRASKGRTFEMPPNRVDLIGWLLDRLREKT